MSLKIYVSHKSFDCVEVAGYESFDQRGSFLGLLLRVVICVFFLHFGAQSLAQVDVAFLELRDPRTGVLIPLEPGGRFGHVAVSYDDGWLHSYPGRPVEWVESLEPFGHLAEVIRLTDRAPLSDEDVMPYLGKPFDRQFIWRDFTSTYCSKFVGQILGIAPQPADFSAEIWQGRTNLGDGLGLSPDDIYRYLLNGRTPVTMGVNTYGPPLASCERLLH